jgi:hypothetical protein
MMNKDLGYDGKQVYQINFNEYGQKPWLKYERLKAEMSKISGVESISYSKRLQEHIISAILIWIIWIQASKRNTVLWIMIIFSLLELNF